VPALRATHELEMAAAAGPLAVVSYNCPSCSTSYTERPNRPSSCVQLPCGLFCCRECAKAACADGVLSCVCGVAHYYNPGDLRGVLRHGYDALVALEAAQTARAAARQEQYAKAALASYEFPRAPSQQAPAVPSDADVAAAAAYVSIPHAAQPSPQASFVRGLMGLRTPTHAAAPAAPAPSALVGDDYERQQQPQQPVPRSGGSSEISAASAASLAARRKEQAQWEAQAAARLAAGWPAEPPVAVSRALLSGFDTTAAAGAATATSAGSRGRRPADADGGATTAASAFGAPSPGGGGGGFPTPPRFAPQLSGMLLGDTGDDGTRDGATAGTAPSPLRSAGVAAALASHNTAAPVSAESTVADVELAGGGSVGGGGGRPSAPIGTDSGATLLHPTAGGTSTAATTPSRPTAVRLLGSLGLGQTQPEQEQQQPAPAPAPAPYSESHFLMGAITGRSTLSPPSTARGGGGGGGASVTGTDFGSASRAGAAIATPSPGAVGAVTPPPPAPLNMWLQPPPAIGLPVLGPLGSTAASGVGAGGGLGLPPGLSPGLLTPQELLGGPTAADGYLGPLGGGGRGGGGGLGGGGITARTEDSPPPRPPLQPPSFFGSSGAGGGWAAVQPRPSPPLPLAPLGTSMPPQPLLPPASSSTAPPVVLSASDIERQLSGQHQQLQQLGALGAELKGMIGVRAGSGGTGGGGGGGAGSVPPVFDTGSSVSGGRDFGGAGDASGRGAV
jgi:hypothetical protein